jgi:hypothetical protein
MSKSEKAENKLYVVGHEVIPEDEYQARIQRERNKKDNIRTTFRVLEKTITQFKDVAKGYKLIDLFEDLADLISSKNFASKVFSDDVIGALAEVEVTAPRKSYLLSRQASTSITKMSKKLGVSRDAVVNYLIIIWVNAQEKQRAQRRKAYEKVQDKFHEAISALEEMEEIFKEEVPSNDPYYSDIGYSLQTLYNAYEAVQNYFETGEYQNDYSV